MENLEQFDTAIYGFAGGSRDIPEREGRFFGGGWIQRPEAFSDMDGMGTWAAPPEADREENNFGPRIGEGNLPGNTYWNDAQRAAGGSNSRWF